MNTIRRIDQLEREELATLAREFLLAGQLMDRAGMPHLISAYGREVMGDIAIDEWMGASPIYTRRTQQLLGFEAANIDTLFKGLQLDIGAPPEFMDFRLKVIDDHHGEFWLDHCGALMDVEPMGDEFVRTMCHAIEDPTFDATAMATSPYARIRPIHRPPRVPADRHPHCHWTATIDMSLDPLPEPEPATHIAHTSLAQLPVAVIEPDGGDGWNDYRAPLDADLRLEMFSRVALTALLHEIGVQTHLLVMSLLFAVERRYGLEAARRIGAHHFEGSVGLTSERLRDAFGLDRSLDAVAQVLEWHPAFQPRTYVSLDVEPDGSADRLVFRLSPCGATSEADRLNWHTLLAAGDAGGALDALVQGVDLQYRCEPVPCIEDELGAWEVVRAEQPARESRDVALTRFSTGSEFRFSETPVELS